MSATCETCRFWVKHDCFDGKTSKGGKCHRFPPVVKVDIYGADLGNEFPTMGMDAWCGEHEPREGE